MNIDQQLFRSGAKKKRRQPTTLLGKNTSISIAAASPMSPPSKKNRKKRRLDDSAVIYKEDLGEQGIKTGPSVTGVESITFDLPLTKEEKRRRTQRVVRVREDIESALKKKSPKSYQRTLRRTNSLILFLLITLSLPVGKIWNQQGQQKEEWRWW
jgi:hypothetical protein